MISAVINKTVKLLNPSLCSQGKIRNIYYQYCCFYQSLTKFLGCNRHHWDPGSPLMEGSSQVLPSNLLMLLSQLYCYVSSDAMISELAGLCNLMASLAETDRPKNPSTYHSQLWPCLSDSLSKHCDETLDKCCWVSLKHLVNGPA